MKIISKYKNFIYPSIIILITAIICILNYTPNTILLGWDSLHPEFNLNLAFQRMFWGVWREDQGLGAIAAHSHMSDIFRTFIIWFIEPFLSIFDLRYFTFFSSIIFGVLGIYFLTTFILKFTHKSQILGFCAALFYLFNLGTLQHFNVPFDMFACAFAIFPFLIYSISLYLKHPNKKYLFLFAALSFVSGGMAYAATLWYVLFICLLIFSFIQINKNNIKRILIISVIPILLNLYWIGPNLFFVKYNSVNVINSKINRLFSPEALSKNKEFGNIQNTATLKNFLFDWSIYDFQTKSFKPVLDTWQNHLNNPSILIIGICLFLIVLLGSTYVIKIKKRESIGILLIFIFSLIPILNNTWLISDLFDFLMSISPVFHEALRFPYTKFSIPVMAAMSILFAHGLLWIMSWFKKFRYLLNFIPIISVLMLFLYFLPAFNGNLIHKSMRIKIPSEYFQMFDWFDQQNHSGRVAILPIHSFWNWTYYKWGYQGAGFLQFGIPQPILDRDYDRWSPYNEQYQREMAYAVYSQNPDTIYKILKKYNIRYILFDEDIIAPGAPTSATLKSIIPDLLGEVPDLYEKIRFSNHIRIFSFEDTLPQIALADNLPAIGPKLAGAPFDWNYQLNGAYQTYENNNKNQTDKNRSLFTADEHFLLKESTISLILNSETGVFSTLKSCSGQPDPIISTRGINDGFIRYVSLGGPLCDHFSLSSLEHDKAYAFEIEARNREGFPLQICISNDATGHCDFFTHLQPSKNFRKEQFFLPPLFDLAHGYTLNINNFAITGFTTVNEIKEIIIKEVDLNKLYHLDISNSSSASSNLNLSKDIFFNDSTVSAYQNNLNKVIYRQVDSWSNSNIGYYKFSISSSNNTTLIFNQAFNDGWKAYNINCSDQSIKCKMESLFPFLYATPIKEHVLVNNWANGWILNPNRFGSLQESTSSNKNSTIVLFFLPQLLEWTGLAMIPMALLLIIYKFKR